MTPGEGLALVHQAAWRLLEEAPVPVYPWLVAQADELPCFVVGAPDLAPETDRPSVGVVTLDVFALGRTSSRDQGAADELRAMGALLADRFWSPPTYEGLMVRLDQLAHGTVDVAGQTVPAYTANLSARMAFCP